ncbi:MAG: cysteine--tRNA ligase [Prevotellaceae bacterium]|jgi:cysteinyl-tRNA synthetase|nr:cysteine--tRNA ligase [Prevotellaceae bacterium]
MAEQKLIICNTLSRTKEVFTPVHPPHVGLYVCGPTVYGDPHLGHARPAITFDLLFRYLKHIGYKVRYVRNITDVGHLENDADEGDDKIEKKARLEELEPMEIAQYYTLRYHKAMDSLNVLPPSIEPRASGHILEQIELIKKILEHGFAYEVNRSIYFDVDLYNKKYKNYGQLSGRILEDLMANTRELDGQSDKHNACDFALWKKASPEHIMRWSSPWGMGFPGWHLECSAMSVKYLGEEFDIHGGGMDLMFPHHECEIAQNIAADGRPAAKYWMHNNMITINGQKMGKSLGNFITLEEMFSGNNPNLERAYSPMTIRFFLLQAHYRSTLDFSNAALQAAEKGLQRLLKAVETLGKLKPSDKSSNAVNVAELEKACYNALNDDLNSPIAISVLFDGVRVINSIHEGKEQISANDLAQLKNLYDNVIFDVLGLQDEQVSEVNNHLTNDLVAYILDLRKQTKVNKDYAAADGIRDALAKLGIAIKDTKDGVEWEVE